MSIFWRGLAFAALIIGVCAKDLNSHDLREEWKHVEFSYGSGSAALRQSLGAFRKLLTTLDEFRVIRGIKENIVVDHVRAKIDVEPDISIVPLTVNLVLVR